MLVASSTLPSFSPWSDGELDQMVQRTFIHAPAPVLTPLPGKLPRSSSTGDLSGCMSARSTASTASSENLGFPSPGDQDGKLSSNIANEISPRMTDVPPAPAFMVPATSFAAPYVACTVPWLEAVAPFPPCPPPALPPVLRLSDH